MVIYYFNMVEVQAASLFVHGMQFGFSAARAACYDMRGSAIGSYNNIQTGAQLGILPLLQLLEHTTIIAGNNNLSTTSAHTEGKCCQNFESRDRCRN